MGGVLRSLATDGDFLPEERKLVRSNKGPAIVTSEDLDGVAIAEDDGELAQGQWTALPQRLRRLRQPSIVYKRSTSDG
ncbi:hypothetical protein CO662_32890 [Rhizobium anhuiense]|uniref:Uncharacterized protein n=1 Tax=Rhizobium anhuiense TaxID=1184720 RepID=A0ABX4J0H1_9HYPH|nr:hypothetical protein CO668_32055 [Rhizobium anhuiense]PDS47837.1 hypothetical protein CO662_32890 [Rhizobium anhuiense]